ncbi:MAG: hypothetical protein U0V75_10360 [Ferruginibacter sp.]
MRTLAYIKYFWYLAYNWNISIALHVIRNEIKGEKYGIRNSPGPMNSNHSKKGIDIEHATIYMPVSYILNSDEVDENC